GMRIVQLFGREADEVAQFKAHDRAHLDAHLKSITVYALYFPAIEILTTIALAALIIAAAPRVEAGGLTVGTLAAFLQLARRFYQPLQDLSDKYNTLQQAMAASERIFKLLDEAPEPGRMTDDGSGKAPIIRHPPSVRNGVTVAFEDVWFAYDLAHLASGATEP